jgi:ABC-type protease/lipase transport system fused ATPase/permease subunit
MTELGMASMMAQVVLLGIGLYLLLSQGLAPGILMIAYVWEGHSLATALSTRLMALYDRYLRSEESMNRLNLTAQIAHFSRSAPVELSRFATEV